MPQSSIIVSPSLLASDFSCLKDGVASVEQAGARWIHFDVMDGNFVPNITFGPQFVSAVRPLTKLFFDVHLMIQNPENFIADFTRAGADSITVHVEAAGRPELALDLIREAGVKTGITLVPATPVAALREVLPRVDMVLVMTVNPGFGGQPLIEDCLAKIEELKEIREKLNYTYLIEADGGINRETYQRVLDAGADVLVMGSAFFNSPSQADDVREIQAYRRKRKG